jgi:rRNA maturation RNase YbeY
MPAARTKAQKTPRSSTRSTGDFSILSTDARTERAVVALVGTRTRRTALETQYRTLAENILGPAYTLSVVFSNEQTIQKLNVQYRKKDYVPNVLSFPLSPTAGEVYICPRIARDEAAQYMHTPEEHMRYLYIHGCLHLQGLDHGAQMDRLEKKYMALSA